MIYLLDYLVNSITGSHIGTVFAMPLSGLLAEHLGWTSVFYVFGKLSSSIQPVALISSQQYSIVNVS